MYSLQCAVEQVPGLHIAGPAQYRPNGLGISEDWLGIEETYMKRRKCGKFPKSRIIYFLRHVKFIWCSFVTFPKAGLSVAHTHSKEKCNCN